ncbi:pyridoxal phosphate-dependent transferase [Achaetomium macrosporum]|uniref:Pyridoxal phosphate-dependent transferase n=1 Tax=Achaetomium macrosporum TaxID=79813 RepID=A0AAN7CEA6_9PEZI|nr:pyridoxal phosphate-dependent transferase [Achaetomium macrosporum]
MADPTVKGGSTGVERPNDDNSPKKLINLLRGWPSPHLHPASQLQAAACRTLSDPSIAVPALQYAPDPGYQPLREELALWLSLHYPAPPIRPDQIAITGGASQGLACVLQSFTDPGYTRAVWANAPCYHLACPIFDDAGFAGRLRAVPEDEGGIDVAWLERRLREEDRRNGEDHLYKSPAPHRKLYRHVIYLVATCANPSGKTLSLARREALVRIAREHNALIISDDVYDFLQWPITPSSPPSPSPTPSPLPPLLPLLSQLDLALGPSPHNPPGKHFSHAISNGSFSKLVGPGVRTGWIHATADFAHGFSQTGSNRSGGAASQFAAVCMHQMLAVGDLQRHVEEVVRPALRRRHALIVAEAGRVLGGLGVRVWKGNEVFGGYFVWLTLPERLDADAAAVAERAREEENLIVAPGRIFEVKGDEEAARFPRNIRLCFSWEEEEDIVEGVARLGRVLKRMLEGVSIQPRAKAAVEANIGEFK